MDTGRSFRPAIAQLDGVRTLIYDRRGWGRSVAARPPATTLDDHVDDLLDLLAGRPATVVAHSFGCCVALAASIRVPDLVRSLGLWEPPFPWLDWWPNVARRVVAEIVADPDPDAVGERMVRRVLGDPAWERLDTGGRARRRAEGRAFVEEARIQLTPHFGLEDVTTPAVTGLGGETWPYMVKVTRRVADALGGELIEVDGAGHFGHVTHPADFAGFARRAIELS